MIIKKLFIISGTLICNLIFSQVGINTTNPDPSSILDIHSDNKGTLFPKVEITSVTDATTIPNPAKGLIIYKPTSTNIEEGLYVNLGSPKSPKWDLVSNSQEKNIILTSPAYMIPYTNGDSSQYLIYGPSVPLYTKKTIIFGSFSNIQSSKITLPKDGIYTILIRPTFNITYNNISTKSTSSSLLNIQFVINKTDINNVTKVFDFFNTQLYIRASSAIAGNDFTPLPASTIFFSGKAGESFTLSFTATGLTDNDGLVNSVKLLAGYNSGYTSIAITNAESPDEFLK